MILQLRKYQWVIVLLVAAVGGGLCMDVGHEWGDDFAMYLNQAQCWIGGGMDALYATNKDCMDASDGLLGPYLYPQGFPLFLSFFMRFFGLMGIQGLPLLYCLKWANYGVFLLVLLAYLRLLNGVFEGHWGKIFLGFVLIAWHPKIWEAADRLNSDLWFTGLVILFFYTLVTPFKGWLSKALTLSLFVFVASASRSNGVFLIAAWFVWEWVDFRKTGKTENRVVSLMMGTMAGLFALYADAGNGSNHWQLLKEIKAETILKNLGVYLEMAGSYPFWHVATLMKMFVQPLLWLCLLIFWLLVGVGFKRLGPVKWAMGVFVLLNFGLYVVWPSVQGMRFLFPLLPLLMVFLVAGLTEAWNLYLFKFLHRWDCLPRTLKFSRTWVMLLAGIVLIQGMMTSIFYSKLDTNQAFSNEMQGVYDFVAHKVSLGEKVSFHKPRLLRMVTGVETYRIATDYGKETMGKDEMNGGAANGGAANGGDTNSGMSDARVSGYETALSKLKVSKIDYWVLSKEQLASKPKPALPIVYENKRFVIYRVEGD